VTGGEVFGFRCSVFGFQKSGIVRHGVLSAERCRFFRVIRVIRVIRVFRVFRGCQFGPCEIGAKV
jgi:hypothetical protein